MGERGVYTPQMIVNGKYAFIGSSRYKGEGYIQRALSEPPEANVNLEVKSVTPDHIQVTYSVSEAPDRCVLQLALVERDIVRRIGSGENSGRTLVHQNVVRFFKTMNLSRKKKGTTSLKIPSDLVRKNSSIVAYVQHADSMKILGVTQQSW